MQNVGFKVYVDIALSWFLAGDFIPTFVTPFVSLPLWPEANRGDYRLLSKVSFGIMDRVVSACNASVRQHLSRRGPHSLKKANVDVVPRPCRGIARPKRRPSVAPFWPEQRLLNTHGPGVGPNDTAFVRGIIGMGG